MVRITLTGDALTGFTSAAADDHVKLFFPGPGETTPRMPAGPPGSVPAGSAPGAIMRDYTPRRFDAARHELDIDFVLHGSGHSSGPAADWAAAARPGSMLGVGGPRGSFVVSGPLDWHLLVGDETALPAIGRHLEELPVTAQVDVLIEVGQPSDEITLQGPSHMRLKWLHRGHAEPGAAAQLVAAVRAWTRPKGIGYAWVAGESRCARQIRTILMAHHHWIVRGSRRPLIGSAVWRTRTISSRTSERHSPSGAKAYGLLICCGELSKDLGRDRIDLLRSHLGKHAGPGGRTRIVITLTEWLAIVEIGVGGFRIDKRIARHHPEKDSRADTHQSVVIDDDAQQSAILPCGSGFVLFNLEGHAGRLGVVGKSCPPFFLERGPAFRLRDRGRPSHNQNQALGRCRRDSQRRQ